MVGDYADDYDRAFALFVYVVDSWEIVSTEENIADVFADIAATMVNEHGADETEVEQAMYDAADYTGIDLSLEWSAGA